MKNKKVSIVIPTHNRIDDLRRLVSSIEKSTYTHYEIIVVNDAGEHIPKDVLDGVTVLSNSTNKGLAYSRTKGAKKSSGEYILFIDDDNIVDPHMTEFLVDSLDRHSSLIAVGPATYYYSNKKKLWFLGSKISLLTTIPSFKRSYTSDELVYQNLLITDNLHNCFMIRRVLGEEVGWFDEEVVMNGTEFDLFQKIKKQYQKMFLATNVLAKCYHDMPDFKSNLLRSLGFENEKRVYYFQRNRGLHVGRHGRSLEKISLLLLFYPFFYMLYAVLFLVHLRFWFFWIHTKATIAGYYYLIRYW